MPRLLHLNEEIGQQVLWAGKATQLESLRGLKAAIQALKTAADLDSLGRALVVISFLPEVPTTNLDDDNQATAPSDSVENQPSSQNHDCTGKDLSAHFQPDSTTPPDTSSFSPKKVEPLTPEQVREMFATYGVPLTEFCRTHKIRYKTLSDLIFGRNTSLTGASQRAAVILGMKEDPKTNQINNPFNGLTPLPYKRTGLV